MGTNEGSEEAEVELIYLGSSRPSLPTIPGFYLCPCGDHLQTKQAIFNHWKDGHFDTPVYITKEEIVAKLVGAMAKAM